MKTKKTEPPDGRPQADKFRDLAREMECDENEEPFREKLRRVAKASLPKDED